MKKDDVILFLEEGMTIEEIPMLELIDEILELVKQSNFDNASKKRIETGMAILKSETINHSHLFVESLKSVTKSAKNEY